MNQTGPTGDTRFEQGGQFQTTSWSAIWTATQSGNPAEALAAWERLCRAYWMPIHAHIRRCGNPPELAKDLTQDFFYHLLRRERLRQADRRKGKFRTFLLAALNHFLHSEWDRRVAKKRDERVVVSLDNLEEAGVWQATLAGQASPDRQFEQDWAMALLARVRHILADELDADNKQAHQALLPLALYEESHAPYHELASRLGMTEDNVKKIVQRLRERWQQILRDEVAATVEHPSEVDTEIRYLLSLVEQATPFSQQ